MLLYGITRPSLTTAPGLADAIAQATLAQPDSVTPDAPFVYDVGDNVGSTNGHPRYRCRSPASGTVATAGMIGLAAATVASGQSAYPSAEAWIVAAGGFEPPSPCQACTR